MLANADEMANGGGGGGEQLQLLLLQKEEEVKIGPQDVARMRVRGESSAEGGGDEWPRQR